MPRKRTAVKRVIDEAAERIVSKAFQVMHHDADQERDKEAAFERAELLKGIKPILRRVSRRDYSERDELLGYIKFLREQCRGLPVEISRDFLAEDQMEKIDALLTPTPPRG